MIYSMYEFKGLIFQTNFCLSSTILRKKSWTFLTLKNFTYYMLFERKFNADKMLLNEYCLKSFRFLVIASDLNMSLIKKLYFLKKNLKLLKDFLTKYVDAPGTCLIIILYRCRAIHSRFWGKNNIWCIPCQFNQAITPYLSEFLHIWYLVSL